MAIVDFHLHFFSRPFFEGLATQSPWPGTTEEKLAKLARETGIELPSTDVAEHTRRWLAEADRHGVEQLCAFASLPEEIPSLAAAGRHAAGRITPFALVNPNQPGEAEKARALIREQGFGGVLLFPAMHHYQIGGAEAEPLLAVLDELRAICYVHCGLLIVKLRDRLGLPRTQDLSYADPLSLVPAAQRHPGASFVIPHFGAGFLREALMAGVQCANVHLDSSSSNSWVATQVPPIDLAGVFRSALKVVGAERILFGTDSNIFPAGWRADRLAEQRAALAAAGASTAAVDQVLGGNAQRLLARVERS